MAAGQADDFPDVAGIESQGETWVALTASDTVNFLKRPKAIAVGAVAGSFQAVGKDGHAESFYANAGQILPIRPIRINATGLTASMVFNGLY